MNYFLLIFFSIIEIIVTACVILIDIPLGILRSIRSYLNKLKFYLEDEIETIIIFLRINNDNQ